MTASDRAHVVVFEHRAKIAAPDARDAVVAYLAAGFDLASARPVAVREAGSEPAAQPLDVAAHAAEDDWWIVRAQAEIELHAPGLIRALALAEFRRTAGDLPAPDEIIVVAVAPAREAALAVAAE